MYEWLVDAVEVVSVEGVPAVIPTFPLPGRVAPVGLPNVIADPANAFPVVFEVTVVFNVDVIAAERSPEPVAVMTFPVDAVVSA